MHLLLVPPNKQGYIRDTYYGCWHKKKFINYSWPPLYLNQLNAVIPDSELMDLSGQSVSRAIKKIKELNPKTVICNTGTFTFKEDLKFFTEIKKHIQTKIIVFGQHPTIDPENTLASNIVDITVRGEPEEIINQIIKNLNYFINS